MKNPAPRRTSKSRRRTVSFTAAQDEALVLKAAVLNISVSDLVRRIVDAWREERV